MSRVGSVVLRQQLVGRKIVNIRMNPFDDGRGGQAFNFEIVLDSGASVFFVVQETESDYGVFPEVQQPEGARFLAPRVQRRGVKGDPT